MKLYNIRLVCGTEGDYSEQMELPRLPIFPSEARKLLLDAFSPKLDAAALGEIALGACASGVCISADISGVPAAALVMEVLA
jgi:hypothetical protein